MKAEHEPRHLRTPHSVPLSKRAVVLEGVLQVVLLFPSLEGSLTPQPLLGVVSGAGRGRRAEDRYPVSAFLGSSRSDRVQTRLPRRLSLCVASTAWRQPGSRGPGPGSWSRSRVSRRALPLPAPAWLCCRGVRQSQSLSLCHREMSCRMGQGVLEQRRPAEAPRADGGRGGVSRCPETHNYGVWGTSRYRWDPWFCPERSQETILWARDLWGGHYQGLLDAAPSPGAVSPVPRQLASEGLLRSHHSTSPQSGAEPSLPVLCQPEARPGLEGAWGPAGGRRQTIVTKQRPRPVKNEFG